MRSPKSWRRMTTQGCCVTPIVAQRRWPPLSCRSRTGWAAIEAALAAGAGRGLPGQRLDEAHEFGVVAHQRRQGFLRPVGADHESGGGSVEAYFPYRRILEERLEGGGTEEAVEGVAQQGLLGVGVERRETILGPFRRRFGQPSLGDAGRHDPLVLPGERAPFFLEGGHGIDQAGVEVALRGGSASSRGAAPHRRVAAAHLVGPLGSRTRATRRAAPSAATRSATVPSSLTLTVMPPAPAAGARSSTTPVPRRRRFAGCRERAGRGGDDGDVIAGTQAGRVAAGLEQQADCRLPGGQTGGGAELGREKEAAGHERDGGRPAHDLVRRQRPP